MVDSISNTRGRSFRALTDDAVARLQGIQQQRYEQMQQAQAVSQGTAQSSQGVVDENGNPVSIFDDPTSGISQHLKSMGLTKEQYFGMNTLRRQKEVVDPFLEKRWQLEVERSPQLQQARNLDELKEQWFNQKRNLYQANFSAVEDREDWIDKGVNFLSDVGQGAVDLYGAFGQVIKPVFGNDNAVSNFIGESKKTADGFLTGIQSDAEQQREQYLGELLNEGRYADAGKLMATNPLMLAGEVGKVAGGVGGWGKGVKLAAAGVGGLTSKVGLKTAGEAITKAGGKVAASMPTYAGIMNGGQTAEELSKRGIDLQTPEGLASTLGSIFAGAALVKLTPHNAENTIARWLSSRGVAGQPQREATKAMMEAIRAGGWVKNTGKALARGGYNIAKGGVNEGIEEYGQTFTAKLASALVGDDGKFRSWDEVPQDQKDALFREAASSGFMGALVGGGLGGVRNANRYGDAQLNAEVKAYEAREARERIEAQKKAEEEATARAQQAEVEKLARIQQEEAEELAREQAKQAEDVQYQTDLNSRNEQRALNTAGLTYDTNLSEYRTAPIRMAQEMEATYQGAANGRLNQHPSQTWDDLLQIARANNDVELENRITRERERSEALIDEKTRNKLTFNAGTGMFINDAQTNVMLNLATEVSGQPVTTPAEAVTVLEQAQTQGVYAPLIRAAQTAIEDRNGSIFSQSFGNRVTQLAKAEQTRIKGEEQVAKEQRLEAEKLRLAEEKRIAEEAKALEKQGLAEEAQRLKDEQAKAKAENDRQTSRRKDNLAEVTKDSIIDEAEYILGSLQGVGIKITSADVTKFLNTPNKFMNDLDDATIVQSVTRAKKALLIKPVRKWVRDVRIAIETASVNETAVQIPRHRFIANTKFRLPEESGKGKGKGVENKAKSPSEEKQGQKPTQVAGTQKLRRVPFNPADVSGAPTTVRKLTPENIKQWIDDVADYAMRYAGKSYADINTAMDDKSGAGFVQLLTDLYNAKVPSTGLSVGSSLAGEVLQSMGLKQNDIVTEPMAKFIAETDAAYVRNIVETMEEWLANNPNNGQPIRLKERFLVQGVRAMVIRNALTENVLRFNDKTQAYEVLGTKKKAPKAKRGLGRGKQQNPAQVEMSFLRADQAITGALTDGVLGEAVRIAMASKSLADTMRHVRTYYNENDLTGRIVSRMTQLAIDNDVRVEVIPQEEMSARFGENARGAYDNATATIYVADGLSYTQTVQTIMHEATHAYFNRTAYAYNSFLVARESDPNVSPEKFGLSKSDVELLEEARRIMDVVRGHKAFTEDRYGVNLVTNENGEQVAYGLSFDPRNPEAVAEFMSELYSSKGFRRAVAEAYSKRTEGNLKSGWAKVKEILRKVAEFLGFTRQQDQDDVAKFIDDSMVLLGTVPYQVANGGVSNLKNGGKNQTKQKPWVTRFVQDAQRGIQYYTFKQKNGLQGERRGVASAYRDLNTGKWDFEYVDPTNPQNVVQKHGITEQELAVEAVNYNLEVLSRNGNTNVQRHISDTVDRISMLYPLVAKVLRKFHQLISNFTNEETANDFVHKLTTGLLWLEHNLHDRDAITTWISRAMKAKYANDPSKWVDIQRQVQALRAQFNAEFTERGVGRKNVYDHKLKIVEWAKKTGWSVERLSTVTYALMAQERTRQFQSNPGGIDPYTGKPIREVGNVSGFMFNGVKDDDGSKFFASLTAVEQQQVDDFKQMWIEMNDGLLDVEYASGVLSTSQYNAMRGKFYAPLKTEGDLIGAFYKRATGRSSVAKDPFGTWFEMAEARATWALKQKENSILLDLAQDHGLSNILQVNQAYRVGLKEEIGHQWRAPNLSDGSSWTVYKNGQAYVLSLADKGMADIYRSAKTWEQKSGFWNTMGAVTRGLSAVRTSLSASFIGVAYARDLLTSMINAQAAFRTFKDGQVVSDSEALSLSMRIPTRAVQSVGGILMGKWTGNRRWQYDVFKRIGGGINMNARMDAEDYNRYFADNLLADKSAKQMVGKVLRKGVRSIMDVSHATEDSVRFATFMEFLEMRAGRKFNDEQDLISFLTSNPELKEQAVSASKHITGNFEVKGNNIGMRSLFMFFNASMVGGRTTVHMFDTKHGTHALKAMGVIATLVLASLASVDADLGDDEDGKSKGSRVSATENGICWGMLGCLQLPHEVRWISALLKAGYELKKGDISFGEGVKMIMRGLYQSMGVPFQVIGADGEMTAKSFVNGLIPTAAQLPYQLLTNTDGFNRDITPEYAYDGAGKRIMEADNWQKSRLNDPDWSKGAAYFGKKYLDLDVSSSQYNHIGQFILGSVYTNFRKVARGMQQGDSFSQIMGSVVGNGFTPKYDEYALVNDMRDRIHRLKSDLSLGDDWRNMVRSTAELKSNPDYARLVALEKQYEKAQKAIKYEGKSYTQWVRERQDGIIADNIDQILAAQEALDLIQDERQTQAGQVLRMLEELELGVYQ